MLVDLRKKYEEYREKEPGLLGQELAFEVHTMLAQAALALHVPYVQARWGAGGQASCDAVSSLQGL